MVYRKYKNVHLLHKARGNEVYKITKGDRKFIVKKVPPMESLISISVPYKLKCKAMGVASPYKVLFGPESTYLYFNYYEKLTLAHYMNKMTFDEKLEAIISIAKTLKCMHQIGYVHNDVKPDNILIDSENRALLTDFELCRKKRENMTIRSGTINFMSPEKFKRNYTEAADVWALGVTAYYVFTKGLLPFDTPETIQRGKEQEVNWEMKWVHLKIVKNQKLCRIIGQMLRYNITLRKIDLDEIIYDLSQLLHKGSVNARKSRAT